MISRFALHAYSLELEDKDGTLLSIVAEYPKDMAVFVKQLRRFDKV